MSSEESKWYVGLLEVTGVSVTEQVTPALAPIVEVTYSDGTRESMTETRLLATRSTEPSNATKAREQLIREAGRKVYAILMEYGPFLLEVDHILNESVRLANDATEQALTVLWDNKRKDQRSLLDVNNILMKHYGTPEALNKAQTATGVDAPTPERDSTDSVDTQEGEVR